MIIATDFDGTISMGEWPTVGPANEGLVRFLVKRQKMGDRLILWTCRAGEELQNAVEYCRTLGLVFDAVNDNLPEIVEKYGSNSRKITCDVYIDDRAVYIDDYEKCTEPDMRRIESALIRYADEIAVAV